MGREADAIPVTLCRGNPARVCPCCGRSRFGSTPCKRRTCPSYADRWAYDWRIVMLENLIAYGGKALMYTLTPPGADVLPWDRSRCSHPPQVKCDGRRGCVVEAAARRAWNGSFQRRLSRLYETVQVAVCREVGVRANVLAIGKEAQKRGPIHAHYVLGVETAQELRAAKAFRRHLERLSRKSRYSFGHVNGKFVKPKPAREAAAYLSSYFLGGRGHKAQLREAVLNPELPRLPLYVSRRLTSATRTTMRNKRRQRHLYICRRKGLPEPAWAQDVEAKRDVLCLAFPVAFRLGNREGLRELVAASP
jgi:transposase-like protein